MIDEKFTKMIMLIKEKFNAPCLLKKEKYKLYIKRDL